MTDPEPNVDDEQRPWQELQRLVEESDADEVQGYLADLQPSEAARAVSRLSEDDQSRLLTLLSPDGAADLVEQLPDVQAADLVERLPPGEAAKIVQELASDDQADLLGELADTEAEAILAAMDPESAAELRTLREYPPDVAGGLMLTETLAFPLTATVSEVLADLRRNAETYEDYEVQYIYVFDGERRLCGVLRLRDLVLARGGRSIDSLMIRDPVTVRDDADLDELGDLFERHSFLGIPVLDASGRLVGVVRRSAVRSAQSQRSVNDYRTSQGILGGDELRTMPTLLRSRRRLSWLSVNILLNIASASVIAFYQDTLSAVIALAVFLPIISDMSGCSGNQAVAVSIRELTLGLVLPREVLRVWGKEIAVGVLNGLALGTLIAGVAWLWKGSPALGLVVGAALAFNTLVAVSVGGIVPLVLRRMSMDPALASGPILTTVTDMCGFLLVLSFAAAAMPYLQGL